MALMTKTTVVTLVTAGVPAVAATPAIVMQLYATPPPLGYVYRPLASPAGFSNWSQLMLAPVQYANVLAGYTFMSVAQIANILLPPGSTFVYGGPPDYPLTGALVPNFVSQPQPPVWQGPVPNMAYITFPNTPVSANGYPTGPGPYSGYFDVPTLTGVKRVTRMYSKTSFGVWVPTDTYTLPAYCVIGGACRVTMLSNFPGRAAVPATPAVYNTDFRDGWNTGGNSIGVIDGDLHTVFQPAILGAGAVGFFNARTDVTRFDNLTHAYYFDTSPLTGVTRYTVMERGVQMRPWATYIPTDSFEIVRSGPGTVVFNVNAVAVYTSPVPLYGPVRVGNALFRGGDGVN